jgi:hypothetical protein
MITRYDRMNRALGERQEDLDKNLPRRGNFALCTSRGIISRRTVPTCLLDVSSTNFDARARCSAPSLL